MPNKVGSLVCCVLFAFQTVLSGMPVRAGYASEAGELLPAPRTRSLWSKALQLKGDDKAVTVADLELNVMDVATTGASILVNVECFAAAETPQLSIDKTVHGMESRLLNITGRRDAECASFGISVASTAPVLHSSGSEGPSFQLAVGVHHSGKPQRDAVGNPAVFVFNPAHGNWTEAKTHVPAAWDPQTAYATLSEHHQRLIVGVIAQPDARLHEAARNGPSSLTGPLDQVSASDRYLAIDGIQPDNKGSYGINLPMLLRPSRGPGPSFSISYNSQGAAGVLGRGWDLSISAIEVRGPAPIYHPDYETEDYVLDGMDLIPLDGQGADMAPLYKGGPIVRRIKSVRFFRLRNSSSALIVRRHGDFPWNYFWEVWNPNSHVTRLYGGKFTTNEAPPAPDDDGNGLLLAKATFSGGVSRQVIGQWGLTQEYDNQPARSGTSYLYYQTEKDGRGCLGKLGAAACRSALRLKEVRYNRALALPGDKVDPSGETQIVFEWTYRTAEKRHNSDGRLGFLRAHQHWLRSISVKYRPGAGNLWLASTDNPKPNDQVTFSTHTFDLTKGDNACMNYDVVLEKYKVDGNSRFDGIASPQEQAFTFAYDGDRYTSKDGVCDRKWSGAKPLSQVELGNLPKDAPGGSIGFPADLLKNFGLGLLAEQSFLGTGRIEETGASAYVGVGPTGDPSVKPISGGFKGGYNFTKSETNSTLVDVTGDGIDDIVARQDGRLRYCGGVRSPDTHFVTYPEDRCGWIEGIIDLARSSTSTFSAGAEVTAYGSVFAGVGFNRSKNDSYIYFTHRDADGLIDLAAYGQVYYGQGETVEGARRVVRFLPNSALTPPLPGGDRAQEISNHLPRDLRATILDIESRLEATARQLNALDYSQTTLAWEAPLDGAVSLAGLFERGEVDPATVPLGGVDPDFGPADFKNLFEEVEEYKEYAYSCEAWPEKDFCHRPFSDPYEAQYTRPADEFSFVRTFDGRLRISLYQRRNRAVVPCMEVVLANNDSFDVGQSDFDVQCRRQGGDAKAIDVRTGDVLYLTYSIHPHFAKWAKPRALVRYVAADNDPAFAISKSGDPDGVVGRLPCNWKLSGAQASGSCALSQLSPYEFDLRAGAVASAPNRAIELAPGRERTFGGDFLIPTWLTQNYAVYVDILASQVAKPASPGAGTGQIPGPVPADTLKLIYRHDVSAHCAGQEETCIVTLPSFCETTSPLKAECNKFVTAEQSHFVVASRLAVQHKVEGAEIAARNIDSVLQDVVWRRPPHIRTVLAKLDPQPDGPRAPGAEVERYSLVYLPISMGQDDIEHFRIETGAFDNPDIDMNEGDPQPEIINFGTMMDLERETVRFTRVRQTLELCRFADEILTYLRDNFAGHASPFAEDYFGYWTKQRDDYGRRCDDAKAAFATAKFTGQDAPDETVSDGLNLPLLLRDLTYDERIASAETLLQRVLANLDLGDQFLTDDHRLTRRGYRLPMKVNPLECGMLGRTDVPLEAPIVDHPEHPTLDCAYRLLANFAMEDFEGLIGKANAANLRAILAPLSGSTAAAFRVELAATVNGRPVAFRELTGEDTGNDACTPAIDNTCLGNYGTTGGDQVGVKEYFYPKGRGAGTGPNPGDPTAGDVLQRVTTNKRAGRAVAFSNSIMSSKVPPVCEREFPLYETGWQMEAKQDCLFNGSDISTETQKYTGPPTYSVAYEIRENNHFVGRNRVVEFRANPLDIVEFQIRVVAVEQSIEVSPGNPKSKVRGSFSVLNGTSSNGLISDRHLIPRSPSDILPNPTDVLPINEQAEYRCPPAPAGFFQPSGRRLPSSCRPWSRIGWAELLLGAEYRTYSDAQKTRRPDEYSIKRRREILRLQPEIEVRADRYFLERTGNDAMLVSQLGAGSNADVAALQEEIKDAGLPQDVPVVLPPQFLAFHSRDPNVAKTGATWALIGGRAPKDGSLSDIPTFPELRYGELEHAPSKNPNSAFKASLDACGKGANIDFERCENHLTSKGETNLALEGYDIFALEHRFVGPVDGGPGPGSALDVAHDSEEASRTGIGQCSVPRPNTTASCWKGPDDTVLLEEPIVEAGSARPHRHSISALVGFERPPLAQFLFEFDSYKRLACLDPLIKEPGVAPNTCAPQPSPEVSNAPALDYPNRPNPPLRSASIPVYAPVQASGSSSVSRNVGALLFNRNNSRTKREQTTAFLDINGDGYPEVITGDRAELTSPVGLSRSDWWRYFRVEENMPSLAAELRADGLNQSGTSVSNGAGIGLSPSTFAVFKQKGPNTKESGSPDAVVDPSFSLDRESGFDESFTELRDFNGDGLADQLTGGTVGQGVTLALNAGGSMVSSGGSGEVTHDAPGESPGTGTVTVGGLPISGFHYNANNSSGFGIRLGFSVESGSYGAGMGLAHRDAGSVATLMDFTGDGRPDIVVPAEGDGGNLLVFPNLGNGFGPGRWHTIASRKPENTSFTETTLVDAGGFYTYGFNLPPPVFVKVVFNVGTKFTRGQTRELLNFRDINGDGFPDLALARGTFLSLDGNTFDSEVHYNPEARYHLLTGVTNPSGSRYLMSHALYGNEGAAHGNAVWALTEVARFDGFEPRLAGAAIGPLADDGHDVVLTRYHYEKGYFNRAERQFYGFARRVATTFGCDLAAANQSCLRALESEGRVTEELLEKAGYRKLQIIDHTFSNRDFLTHGIVLSQSAQGFQSRPLDEKDNALPVEGAQALSASHFGYTIEHLEHHATIAEAATCAMPSAASLLSGSWDPKAQSGGSKLSALWDGSNFQLGKPVLGQASLCGSAGGPGCAKKLETDMCRSGFMREQQAFWAQQSGSVRHRIESLEIFGGGVTSNEAKVPVTPRLRSEVAFDYDQWGQVQTFISVGEATPEWTPGPEASAHAKITYAVRQGLNAAAVAPTIGYPLLGLAEEIRVFGGGWGGQDGPSPTLRVRHALYSQDGRGNLTDVCTYPVAGLEISPKLCETYKKKFRRHLGDGYSTMQAALRATYAEIDKLPKGANEFDAVVHNQLVDYDEFGNLKYAVSPLTGSKEWIERRFSYAADPFRSSATTTALTRCVEDIAGAGTDAKGVEASNDRCGFGLDALPEPVRRTAVTHHSTARIDTHTGAVAETRDINGNSILLDYDRWGRLRLIARGWGNIARENRTFAPQLRLAIAKSLAVTQAPQDVPSTDEWRILALADYERPSDGLLRSNLRRFDPSDSYSGLLNRGKTTRETALFADGNGRPIQSIREADVCIGVPDHLVNGTQNATKDGKSALPQTSLEERCQDAATAVVTPASAIDALGRELLSFESYPFTGSTGAAAPGGPANSYKTPRFGALAAAKSKPTWLSRSVYDGAGRPTLVQSRLALEETVPQGRVRGSAQYRYRIVPAADPGTPLRRLARFEALSLSPRCSVSAAWSDARGLTRTVFEQQARLYSQAAATGRKAAPNEEVSVPPFVSEYERDYALSWGDCEEISQVAQEIGPAIEQSAGAEWSHASGHAAEPSLQPVRVSYAYDPMQQLTGVSYPLAGQARASITVRYDMIGRMTELHEPNSGCTSYRYDPMNLLVAVRGFHFEPNKKSCGTTTRVANEKHYRYSADRLVEMAYRSLDEQGGADDGRDTVRFYHDSYPHAEASAELLETPRYVSNDDANRRFVDVTGRVCDNCIGQVTVVSDRTGARSFAYNALGLVGREVRSIVAPLKDAGLTQSSGAGEAYLPEVAFHEIENSYTAFGDLAQQRFAESAPSNPHQRCIDDGVETCIARFTIGRKYAPDGAVAELLFNGRPLISAAQDALGRPAIRWTADGTTTGYRYDGKDMRLNQLATLTAGVVGDGVLPVQVNGYQYDGGGNVLAYTNRAIPEQDYESAFGFGYDAVNRLTGFAAVVRKKNDRLESRGRYAYDEGHRFVSRGLSIKGFGEQPSRLERQWTYRYDNVRDATPLHAPKRIEFQIDTRPDAVSAYDDIGAVMPVGTQPPDAKLQPDLLATRAVSFAYDDNGRMTRIGAPPSDAKVPLALLSNRAMSWDAEGRLVRVRGVADGAAEKNADWLREDYIYDAGGNRTLRIHRPRVDATGKPVDEEEKAATATIYLTPFYAKTLDRRGAVQIAEGSLPAASLDAPADGNEAPIVTYVHSDLAVGSVTAGVTAYGEAQDADEIVIARREYSPYGLELTADWLADTGRPGSAKLSVFHGKELDRTTNFSSFGARSYSRDLGIWLSPDPMMAGYLGRPPSETALAARTLSTYTFAGHNPVRASDSDGRIIDTILDAGFIIYDIGALAYDEYKTGGANRTENFTALAADFGGLLVPFATGGGVAVRGGLKLTDNVASAVRTADSLVPSQLRRGKLSEKQVLDNLILTENKAVHSTSFKNTIPDADFTDELGRELFEIKDVKKLNLTKQLKAQIELVEKGIFDGMTLAVGKETKLSKPLREKLGTIDATVIRSDSLMKTKVKVD